MTHNPRLIRTCSLLAALLATGVSFAQSPVADPVEPIGARSASRRGTGLYDHGDFTGMRAARMLRE